MGATVDRPLARLGPEDPYRLHGAHTGALGAFRRSGALRRSGGPPSGSFSGAGENHRALRVHTGHVSRSPPIRPRSHRHSYNDLASLLMLFSTLLAAACASPLAAVGPARLPVQGSTLLVDLSLEPNPVNPSGSVRPRGVGLGRLWIEGISPESSAAAWTVSAPGAEPQPFFLPTASGEPESVLRLRGVAELGPGRALLAVKRFSEDRLYVTDGTFGGSAELPVHLASDLGSFSAPENFELPVVGNEAFFLGLEDSGAERLFATDGTPGGLRIVLPNAADVREFTVFGNQLVYLTESGGSGSELRAVGLAGGTSTLLAASSSTLGEFEALGLGGRLVFNWSPGPSGSGEELWVTDGTAAGTLLLVDVQPGPGSSTPMLLAGDGARAFFSATRSSEGRELWVTDGTAAGTALVRDLQPGAGDGMGPGPQPAAMLGSQIVVRATTGPGTSEPWISNGTASSTQRLANLPGGATFWDVSEISPVGSRVAFDGRTNAEGTEPWVTDGVAVERLGNLEPGAGSSDPGGLLEFAGVIYFGADALDLGRELWSSGPAGLAVDEIGVGAATLSSDPQKYVEVAGGGYFRISRPASPLFAMFYTDGTAQGTVELAASDELRPFGALDQGLIFRSDAGGGGVEPWYSDGTPGGTFQLAELAPGSASSTLGLADHGVQVGSKFYFLATTPATGFELFETDGTPAGTRLSFDLEPGPGSGIDSGVFLIPGDDQLFFPRLNASASLPGESLWRTDGTLQGTYPVDLFGLGSPDLESVEPIDGGLLIAVNGPSGSYRVGRTDGSIGGETLDFERMGTCSQAMECGGLVFVVERPLPGSSQRLIAVDAAGNATVLFDGVPNVSVVLREAFEEDLMFAIVGEDFELEGLWVTDGTQAGTVRLDPTSVSFRPIGSGESVLGGSFDPALGIEPRVIDVGAATVALTLDSEPGARSSNPRWLGRAGNRVLFGAFTLEAGDELHYVDLVQAGTFLSEPYGAGCGLADSPDLRVQGAVELGEVVSIEVDEAAPSAVVLYYASSSPAALPVGGCTLYLAPPLVNVAIDQADAAGHAALDFALTGPSSFLGVELYLQAAVGAVGGPVFGAFELTNGVEVVIGN